MKPILPTLLLAAALAPRASAQNVEEARAFLEKAEAQLAEVWTEESRASWVHSNFITYDTDILAAQASEKSTALSVSLAKEAARFQGLDLPPDLTRKLLLLRLALVVPAPSDPAKTKELAAIETGMESAYGRGKYCPEQMKGECWDLPAMEKVLAESRDPKLLLDVWRGWHEVAVPLRKDYIRYVELGNEGARELGFKDLGAMWRSNYDMPPDEFEREVDRLWEQVKPLYLSLHAYVRRRLIETYGKDLVPERGPIPAHLLGNMWAQQWGNVYPLVAPKDGDPGYDLTERLKAKGLEPLDLFHYGENFFTSLGFAPMPQTFWERSLFIQPRDRDVVCHASAWDIDYADDIRIKMCI
ncbi:MAG TPA: M2 family metallopeptidase, partial [Vicinamibacteria bacterium]